MLVCTNKLSFHLLGFLCALTSTAIFVIQNIVSKAIFNNQAAKKSKRMDKYNLLFYSSVTSFMLMTPLWFYADGLSMFGRDSKNVPSFGLIGGPFSSTRASNSSTSLNVSTSIGHLSTADRITATPWHILYLFVINGICHFAQAGLSFTILAQVSSPVTFSIASLLKRIVVIVASIVYFGEANGVTRLQWVGLVMTFLGLWMYDRAKMETGDGSEGDRHATEENVDLSNSAKRKDERLPV
ncbi:suppressor of loss of ypt1 [Entophlyctis sp. JEL0112]|nr:suppressor of loss of ypt1 [Entophlyctis sp. JEL0112]